MEKITELNRMACYENNSIDHQGEKIKRENSEQKVLTIQ